MILPSKELLSEVLNRRKPIGKIKQVANKIRWYENLDGECSDYMDINIYELAHKCKEWALNQSFCLMSCMHDNGKYNSNYYICEILTPNFGGSSLFNILHKTTDGTTEPEVIFKACEWILEQKEKK